MEWLKKLDAGLELAEKALIVFLVSVLILLISFNILTRNLFNYSFQAILEAAPGNVLWLALTGSTLAMKKNRHIKLELIRRYLGGRARRFTRIVCGVIGLTIMALLFFASIVFVRNEIQIFGAVGWVSVAFPLFFAVVSFRYARQVVDGRHFDDSGDKAQ